MRKIESIDTKVNGVTFYNDDDKASKIARFGTPVPIKMEQGFK